MGVNVITSCEPREHRGTHFLSTELASDRNNQYPPSVELVRSDFKGRWPELFVRFQHVKRSGDIHDPFYPDEVNVRIHGITVKALMDALIENPDTRRYLASGVDGAHHRSFPVGPMVAEDRTSLAQGQSSRHPLRPSLTRPP
jgi:hypothetical protein